MSLTPGTRLGPYEIVSAIGAGGMGEVYRATDRNLKRPVAIKVLPAAMAGDADRLARLQREAEVLATLNHPNVAAIYGLEKTPDVTALVMELVEGEDLSAHIARGPMPLADALPIAKQIAEALEAAHEQGIIHRDLKPANIKVRADGTVKVLDFGLAKAMDPTGAASGAAMSSPKTTALATQMGVILGTAAYMAPEQARGKPVDKRADIWAFGLVLFEMLSGARAFEGEEISAVLARVLERDPEWAKLPAATPPGIRRLLERCLTKDPRARLRDIGEARHTIDEVIAGRSGTRPVTRTAEVAPAPVRRWSVGSLVVAALAGGLVVGSAGWLWPREGAGEDRPSVRLAVDLGASVDLPGSGMAGASVVLAPDGSRIAWVSGSKAFTRRLDERTATEVAGSDGAGTPFFSPDGRWLGFIAHGRVYKTPVDGGAVVPLADTKGEPNGARWASDGSLYVTDRRRVLRLPSDGGTPQVVTEAKSAGDLGVYTPEVLPGASAVVYAVDHLGPVDATTIEAVRPGNPARTLVLRGGASPRFVATGGSTGYLLYVNRATLFAIPFDTKTLKTSGTAVPVLDDVANEPLVGTGQFDVSAAGTIVYRRDAGTMTTRLEWAGGVGPDLKAIMPAVYTNPALSPDGTHLAMVTLSDAATGVWNFDLVHGSSQRLTTVEHGTYPRWSPDGSTILSVAPTVGIYQARADGSRAPSLLFADKYIVAAVSSTPDGRRLAFSEYLADQMRIVTMPIEARDGLLVAGTPEPFLQSASTLLSPEFSPDGRWLAYASNETGRSEVYVRAFPAPASGDAGHWQVSTDGGEQVRWSKSTHEIVFVSRDGLMKASYTASGDRFAPETPRVWIEHLSIPRLNGLSWAWDLAADGSRAIALTPAVTGAARDKDHEVVFVEHFVEQLRKAMAAAK